MSPTTDDLVRRYVRSLNDELRNLPKARRREVVEEIAAHIDDARAELASESEVDVRNILERLGAPEEIAAEARERFGMPEPGGRTRELAAILLLLFGGFLFVVGWFAGLVLLWSSEVWSTREKIVGTVLVPGGLALPFWLATQSLTAGCTGVGDSSGRVLESTCQEPSLLSKVFWAAVVVFVVIGPIVGAIYLVRGMRRPRVAASFV